MRASQSSLARRSRELRDAHQMCSLGARALTAAPVDFKMNANHFSFSVSVGALNPSIMIIYATRCPVLFRSFNAALNAVVNPDDVKATVQLYICGSDSSIITECSMNAL